MYKIKFTEYQLAIFNNKKYSKPKEKRLMQLLECIIKHNDKSSLDIYKIISHRLSQYKFEKKKALISELNRSLSDAEIKKLDKEFNYPKRSYERHIEELENINLIKRVSLQNKKIYFSIVTENCHQNWRQNWHQNWRSKNIPSSVDMTNLEGDCKNHNYKLRTIYNSNSNKENTTTLEENNLVDKKIKVDRNDIELILTISLDNRNILSNSMYNYIHKIALDNTLKIEDEININGLNKLIERNIDVAIKYIENKHNIDPIHYQPNKKVIESNNNTIDNIDIIDTINTDTADNNKVIDITDTIKNIKTIDNTDAADTDNKVIDITDTINHINIDYRIKQVIDVWNGYTNNTDLEKCKATKSVIDIIDIAIKRYTIEKIVDAIKVYLEIYKKIDDPGYRKKYNLDTLLKGNRIETYFKDGNMYKIYQDRKLYNVIIPVKKEFKHFKY